jgi:hypothetical protein
VDPLRATGLPRKRGVARGAVGGFGAGLALDEPDGLTLGRWRRGTRRSPSARRRTCSPSTAHAPEGPDGPSRSGRSRCAHSFPAGAHGRLGYISDTLRSGVENAQETADASSGMSAGLAPFWATHAAGSPRESTVGACLSHSSAVAWASPTTSGTTANKQRSAGRAASHLAQPVGLLRISDDDRGGCCPWSTSARCARGLVGVRVGHASGLGLDGGRLEIGGGCAADPTGDCDGPGGSARCGASRRPPRGSSSRPR